MDMKAKFELLDQKTAEALKGGGEDRIEAQPRRKPTARERANCCWMPALPGD